MNHLGFWIMLSVLSIVFVLNLFLRGQLTRIFHGLLATIIFGVVVYSALYHEAPLSKIVYCIVLALLLFDSVIGPYLEGCWSDNINNLLTILILGGMFGFCIYLFGWLIGIITFICLSSLQQICKETVFMQRLAFFLTGTRRGYFESDNGYDNLDNLRSSEDFLARMEQRSNAQKRKMFRVLAREEVTNFMQENNLIPADIEELSNFLGACYLSDLTWDILSNPSDISRIIEYRKQKLNRIEICLKFRKEWPR